MGGGVAKWVLLAVLVAWIYGQGCQKGGICDIALVVDRSGSIKKFDKQERNFVDDLLNLLFHKYTDLRVGLVRYSSKNTAKFDPGMTSDKDKLHDRVDDWSRPSGSTYTHEGIEVGADQLLKSASRGGARSSCKIMYVITDGKSKSSKSTAKQAARARSKGIEIFAVGVAGYDMKELKSIASDPDSEHVITGKTFKDVDQIIANDPCLKSATCDEKPAAVEGGSWDCVRPVAHGATCAFNCDHTRVSGDGAATCTDGTWQGWDDEACTAAPCPNAPTPVQHGSWNCTLPVQAGDGCDLTCSFGHRAGDASATCHDGQWTGVTDEICNPPTCPKNTFAYAGSTYKFTSMPMSWTKAQAEAQAQGGFLLSVSTQEESDFITNQIFGNAAIAERSYWIGIWSKVNPPVWAWTSHAPVTFTNWETPPTLNDDTYGLINDEYILTKNPTWLGKWTVNPDHDQDICGIVEIPPVLKCDCNTPPDASSCAAQECSTLRSNVWSMVMCTFDMAGEFGSWSEGKPNHFSADLNAGYTCVPADSAVASLCP